MNDLTVAGRLPFLSAMKTIVANSVFALFLGVAVPVGLSAQSAKDDAQNAGENAKQAGKDAGRATSKTAKKGAHKVKRGTKNTAHKGAQKTKEGASKVEQKTR